jgi:toxin HigB-1
MPFPSFLYHWMIQIPCIVYHAMIHYGYWQGAGQMAIKSFKDDRLAALLKRRTPKGFPADLVSATRRKLAILDAAGALDDLCIPPANRLEALKGDRAGQYSIRVNNQFRLCFRWTAEGPADVEFTDYH